MFSRFFSPKLALVLVTMFLYFWCTSLGLSAEFQRLSNSYQCAILFDSKYSDYRNRNFLNKVEPTNKCCETEEKESYFFAENLLSLGVAPNEVAELLRLLSDLGGFSQYFSKRVQGLHIEGSIDEVDNFLKSWFLTLRDHNMDVNQPIVQQTKDHQAEISQLYEQHNRKVKEANLTGLLMVGATFFQLLSSSDISIYSIGTWITAGTITLFFQKTRDVLSFRSQVRKKYGVTNGSLLFNYASGVHTTKFNDEYFKNSIPNLLREGLWKHRQTSKINKGQENHKRAFLFRMNKMPNPDVLVVFLVYDSSKDLFTLDINLFTND